MGRFYKTSKPEYLDFIYKQPNNLLLKAVEKAEAGVDKNLASVADLYGRLKSEALKPDTERRDEIIQGYKKAIDDLSMAIYKDPMSFRGYTPTIKKTRDAIMDNLERGELAAMASNVKARQAYSDKLDAQVKAKSISQPQANWLLNKYDNDFRVRKGTKYAGPSAYQSYKTGYFAPDIDLYKKIDERGAGWRADAEEKGGMSFAYDENNDRYIATWKESGEVVSRKELKKSFSDYVMRDPEIRDYYKTRIGEGYFGTQEQGTNRMLSDLNAAVNYGMDKFGYTKTSSESGIKDYGLSGLYASQKLNKTTPLVDAVVSEGEVNIRNYSDPDAIDNLVASIEKSTNEISSGVKQSIERKFLEENGITYDPQTKSYLKDGKPVTLTEKQTEELTEKLDDFNNELEKAKQSGDYTKVKEMTKDMNPAIKKNVEALSLAHTPSTQTAIINNQTLEESILTNPEFEKAFEEYKKATAFLGAVGDTYDEEFKKQYAREFIKEKGLDKATSQVKFNQDIDNATQYQKGAFIDAGKKIAESYQMFNEKGVLLLSSIGEDGKIVTSKTSADFANLLKNDVIPRQQVILKQINERIGKKGALTMQDGETFISGEDEKIKIAEPIAIGDGKFIEITPDYGKHINYTYNNLPGTNGNEPKYVQSIIINQVDEEGNPIEDEKGNPIQTKATIAQNFSNFTFKLVDGTNFNDLIKGSAKAYKSYLGDEISKGIQQSQNFVREQIETNFKGGPGKVQFFSDGNTKLSYQVKGGQKYFYVNDKLVKTGDASDSEIQIALMNKVLENRNNSGIK
jgi:hypothetical protein